VAGRLVAILRCRPGEGAALALSFAWFALLLASYYMLRPLRDALGAGLGPGQIKYLSACVFVTMLLVVPVFGALVARVPRRHLVPGLYAFFVLDLLGFAAAFAVDPGSTVAARVFYVWVTAYNLFVVSVFWSFMADVWREEQARRLFGVIAAGGSLGGLVGPVLTRALVGPLGVGGLAALSAACLALTLVAIVLLGRTVSRDAALAPARLDEPTGGAILAGLVDLARSPFLLGIAGLVALGSLLGMFVYVEIARLAAEQFHTAADRAAFYAGRDLAVNALALVFQFAVVGRLAERFGVRATLAATGLLAALAFAGLGLDPVLGTLVVVNVVLRTLEFGVGKPARDMLYTVVEPGTKYKVKNVVDTAVYRASDTASSWTHDLLADAGVGLGGFGWLGAAVAATLAALGWAVGTGYRRRGGT
jgi:AAA family ATP:ADP antiporter